MADNTVKLTIKVSDDGSLQVTAKNADKAAKSTDNLSKSTDKASSSRRKYSKGEKGVAGATSNSTKAFSKMRNSMTGDGGLVPAYATLAANVFAVTAAFGILQRTAAVKQLEEGLIFTGRAAGQNLPFLVESLKEITGAALSTADAMRAVAVGTSAGFSQTQLEGLTKVAKGASLALGRDMADAMDRLVRGAAKLEPEILDELGIMVRLDEASSNFALTLNKTANELTVFEKRMAFTNAIITQGEAKFGALARVIDPNPYDQLAATFDNLTKSALSLFNDVLQPVLGLLGSNTVILAGSIAALGGSVVRQLVPALTSGGVAMAAMADEAKAAGKANLQSLKSFNGAPKVFDKLADKVAAGTATLDDRKKLLASIDKSEQAHLRTMDSMIAKHGKESKQYKEKIAKMNGLAEAKRVVAASEVLDTQAKVANTQATVLNAAAQGNLKAMLAALRVAWATDIAATLASTKSKGALTTALALLRTGFSLTIFSVKAFSIALLNSIPIIGQILLILGLVVPMIIDFFSEPPTALEEAIKSNAEAMSNLAEINAQLAITYSQSTTAAERFFAVLEASTGIINTTNQAVQNVIQSQLTEQLGKEMKARKKVAEAVLAQERAQQALKKEQEEGVGFIDRMVMGFAQGALMQSQSLEKVETPMQNALTKASRALDKAKKELEDVFTFSITDVEASSEAMLTALIAATSALQTQKTMAQATGKSGEEVELLKQRIDGLKNIMLELNAGGSVENAAAQMTALNTAVLATQDAAKSATDAMRTLQTLFVDNTKTGGEFGDKIEATRTILEKLKAGGYDEIVKKYGQSFDLLGVARGDVSAFSEALNQMIDVNDRLLAMPYEEQLTKIATMGLRNAGLEQSALKQELSLNEKKKELLYDQMSIAARQGDTARIQEINLTLLQLELDTKTKLNKEEAERNRLLGLRTGASSEITAGQTAIDIGSTLPENATIGETFSSENLASMREGFQGMIGDLAKLGPEGEVMAAITQGAFIMSEQFAGAFEKMEEGTFGLADGIGIAASAISQLGAIQSAQGKAAVASIDKEIKAEQARDGQSAKSVAKIKALEAKKEATKRKNFERDKKMQMGSIVASTAVGIMKAYEQGGMLGFVTGSIIAAIGAMQLATVASSSYDGGGSSAVAGGGAPSKVTMGSRSNVSDLATSRSARGELAYARGESGTGNMSNFKSAFSGYRSRAEGGNTGLIVGEQGPELFVPEMPGRIVPNDDIAAGGVSNVSFNINAVDASGVEDLLVAQRGNIIGMIRQAANSYGQDFVEDVDTSTFTQSAGGVSKY